MFVKNKNMNGLSGNRNEIITLINNVKNENASLKNENENLKNNTDLINKNTLLLSESNKLLIKNINNSEIITQYKIVIEKLKYENITLKKAYNVADTISCLDSDDE